MSQHLPALVGADGVTPLRAGVPAAPRREASYGDSRWPGASRGRQFKGWNASGGSADSDNIPEIDLLARRGRDLERNEAGVYSAVQQQVQSIVGSGLQVVPTPDWFTLGKSKEWADGWSRVVRNLHRNWADTSDCDASRQESLGFMAGELLTSTVISGAGVAVPYYLPDNGLTQFGTCFRIVEADRLCNPNFQRDTDSLRRGVHIDPETGAPLGYWLCNRHPGDYFGQLAQGVPREWVYIPAFTSWGCRRLIHVFPRRRPEQTAGVSALATVAGDIRDVTESRRAELRHQAVTAGLSLIVNSDLKPDQVMAMFRSPSEFWESIFDPEFQPRLDAGATIVSPPGTTTKPFAPARNAQNFDTFLCTAWRQICAGLDIPYEVGTRDYSNLNYSNARTILLDAWRTFLTKRTWLGQRFYDPVYQTWFEEAVHLGLIPDCTPDDLYAPGMATAWTAARWIGPGKGWVDPLKEAQAQGVRMGNYTTTMEQELAEQGMDWQEVAEQQHTEAEFFEKVLKRPYPLDIIAQNPRARMGGNGGPPMVEDDERER